MNSLDRRFFRVHLGRQASDAQECFENNFVGVHFSFVGIIDLDFETLFGTFGIAAVFGLR